MNMIPGIHNKTIKIRSTNVWDHSHIPQHDPIFFFSILCSYQDYTAITDNNNEHKL